MGESTLRPAGWSVPRLLLLALVVGVALSVGVAGYTSTTAFETYNPAWDGASDLRSVAGSEGAEVTVALNASAYDAVEPNGTVAVLLSPDDPYGPTDRRRLRSFARAGGTLVVAEDVDPDGNDILAAVGADSRFDGGVVRDERHNYQSPALPVATEVADDPATEGVEELTLNYGTVVDPGDDATVLAATSEFAYVDRDGDGELSATEELATRPVVVAEPVGAGTVVAVGDPSLFVNAMLDRTGNRRLVGNLAAAHDRVLLDYSHLSGQPPLATAVIRLRGSPPAQAALLLVGIGTVLAWSRRSIDLALADRTARLLPPSLRRGGERERSVPEPSPAALRAYLESEHPEWDGDRVERVMAGVMNRRTERRDDD